MTATRDRRTPDARRRQTARKQAIAREVAVARPFQPPPCARCGLTLCDAHGNPRWDIVGTQTFVCLGGCPSLRPTAPRKNGGC